MPDSSTTLHEPAEQLRPETIERHRAIVSLMEELEAVDWYSQRIDASTDAELREVLAHNRDEEMEHAVMTLEWLRRHDPGWDAQLRQRLFTDGPIAIEDEATGDERATVDQVASGHGLGIGALHEEANL
jgi:ferritin-like protein